MQNNECILLIVVVDLLVFMFLFKQDLIEKEIFIF